VFFQHGNVELENHQKKTNLLGYANKENMPIKENRVKPAADSKKDRRADKYPLTRAPTAFSFPKQ